MASEHAFGDAQAMLDAARVARLEITVFRHNVDIPGETSALARAFWLHIPELSKRMGLPIEENEGHPPGIKVTDESLLKLIAADIETGRPYASWLATHIGPQTTAMFAKGGDNAFDPLFDRIAAERGFKRDDALTREASLAPRGAAIAAAMAAGQGR